MAEHKYWMLASTTDSGTHLKPSILSKPSISSLRVDIESRAWLLRLDQGEAILGQDSPCKRYAKSNDQESSSTISRKANREPLIEKIGFFAADSDISE